MYVFQPHILVSIFYLKFAGNFARKFEFKQKEPTFSYLKLNFIAIMKIKSGKKRNIHPNNTRRRV